MRNQKFNQKPWWFKVLIAIPTLFLVICISFYIIVLSGLFPNLQELWVTTAMTTMNHKWLATAFIPQSTIDDIMERTYVDDSLYRTQVDLIHLGDIEKVQLIIPENVTKLEKQIMFIPTIQKPYSIQYNEPYDKYVREQGYIKLEDGLYKKEVNGVGLKGYLMLVTDPSRISLADTKYQYNRGQTVKEMVADNQAIAGVNAGGFVDGPNYNSNGGTPAGLLIVNGEVVCPTNINDRTIYSVIGFNTDNILVLGKMTTAQAIEANIRDAVNFKPFLIVNGETVIKEGTGGWGIAPRTALGQRSTGEVVLLVFEGRRVNVPGVDLRILQDTLYAEGCVNAAMVDGGSSTVMVYRDEFVNKPSLGYERWINNCWIIK